jgi:23S rRNA (uracil1939-C5)-methyltransferase
MQHERELLNPPRAGAKEIAPLLSHWKPSHIVYVSCNRTTLAHDVDILKDNGFTLRTAGVMDMFPHTKHV